MLFTFGDDDGKEAKGDGGETKAIPTNTAGKQPGGATANTAGAIRREVWGVGAATEYDRWGPEDPVAQFRWTAVFNQSNGQVSFGGLVDFLPQIQVSWSDGFYSANFIQDRVIEPLKTLPSQECAGGILVLLNFASVRGTSRGTLPSANPRSDGMVTFSPGQPSEDGRVVGWTLFIRACPGKKDGPEIEFLQNFSSLPSSGEYGWAQDPQTMTKWDSLGWSRPAACVEPVSSEGDADIVTDAPTKTQLNRMGPDNCDTSRTYKSGSPK